MFKKLYESDSDLLRFLNKATDIFGLSILWLVCSLPLVTIGPATAALYRSTVRCVRGGKNGPFLVFLETFKENFKVGALTSLIVLLVAAIFLFIHDLLAIAAGTIHLMGIYYYMFLFVMILPVGILCWLFPLLSRFTFGVRGLIATGAKLAMLHLPTTLLLGAMLIAAAIFSLWLLLPVGFMPVVIALLQSLLMERVFRPFEEAQAKN